MKKSITTIGRGAVYLMGLGVFAVCAILLPELAREEAVGKINPPPAYPYLIAAWGFSLPVYIALIQTLKLLRLIDENQAFSPHSVKSLKVIKYCSVAFGALIVLGAVTVTILAKSVDPSEDVAPVITISFVFALVSAIIAAFISVFERLLKDVIDYKSENDLTV